MKNYDNVYNKTSIKRCEECGFLSHISSSNSEHSCEYFKKLREQFVAEIGNFNLKKEGFFKSFWNNINKLFLFKMYGAMVIELPLITHFKFTTFETLMLTMGTIFFIQFMHEKPFKGDDKP